MLRQNSTILCSVDSNIIALRQIYFCVLVLLKLFLSLLFLVLRYAKQETEEGNKEGGGREGGLVIFLPPPSLTATQALSPFFRVCLSVLSLSSLLPISRRMEEEECGGGKRSSSCRKNKKKEDANLEHVRTFSCCANIGFFL